MTAIHFRIASLFDADVPVVTFCRRLGGFATWCPKYDAPPAMKSATVPKISR